MPVPIPTLGSQKNPLSTVNIADPALRDRGLPSRTYTVGTSATLVLGDPEAGLESGVYIVDVAGSAEYGLFLIKSGSTTPIKIAGSTNVVVGAPGATQIGLVNAAGILSLSGGSGTIVGTPAGVVQFYRVG